jgi:hypothetical protein
MRKIDLVELAEAVGKARRISFADVRRLQRDILPNGITSRQEVELLLQLERTVAKIDKAFANWLVVNVVDYVVWGARPTGRVDEETALWLAPLLQGKSRTASRIAHEIVVEAQKADPTLHALADGLAARSPASARAFASAGHGAA